jgi:uncharacterized protein (DUF58 family)
VLVHLAAIMAFAALKNNGRVGLVLFSDQIEHFVPPKKGRPHIHRLLRDLLYFKPQSQKTNIKQACEYISHILTKKATVFIFSDFLDQNYESPLRLLARRHEVACVVVEDSLEKSIPSLGLVDMEDAETGDVVTVDTSSANFKTQYSQLYSKMAKTREDSLRKSQVASIKVGTEENFVDPLIRYFAGVRGRFSRSFQ